MKNLNLIKILNKFIFSCYILLFILTPLIMSAATSELFEFNKMLFIYFITLIILFFWLAKMIVLKKIILKKTLFDIPIFIFLLSQVFSTFLSIDPHTSFYGYYGRFNGGLLSIITYITLFYGFVSNIENSNQVLTLLKTSVISSILVIFWGLPGKVGYDLSCLIFTGQWNNQCWTDQFRPAERMFSTLGQPNWLGAYLAINFFIAIYFFLNENSTNKNWLFPFYLFLNFISILFTRSRSALAAVIFGLILLIVYLFLSKRDFLKRNLLILLVIPILSILIFKTGIEKIDKYTNFWQLISSQKVNYQRPQAKNSLYTKIKVTESFDIRKIVWKGAIDLGKRYPFFGTGVETFAYAYYFVRPKEHNLTSEWDYLYNKAHNEYLNYLATTGFFGLVSYLLMIAFVFYLSILNIFRFDEKKSKNQTKNQKKKEMLIDWVDFRFVNLCLMLSFISILITNFFGFSTTTINLFFYLIPAFLLTINLSFDFEEKTNEENEFLEKLTNKQKLFFGILSSFIVYLLFFIIKYWLADYYYAKADFAFKNNQYQLAAFYLQNKSLKLKYEHVYEDRLSYILANLAWAASYQKEKGYAVSFKKLSSFYNQHSLQQSPKNVLYWKTKAKIHYLFFQTNMDLTNLKIAIDSLKQAQKLSPTDPKIPYTLAFFYSIFYENAKNNKEKELYKNESLKAIDYVIELKNDMIDAYLLKGQLLKKYKQANEAKEVYRYILNNLDSNDQEAKKELGIN